MAHQAKGTCPNRCNYEEQRLSTLVSKLLSKIKLKCLRSKDGCDENIYHDMYLNHITETCKLIRYRCKWCPLTGREDEVSAHVDKCDLIPVKCSYCKETVIRKDLESHTMTCDLHTKQCRFAQKYLNMQFTGSMLKIAMKRYESVVIAVYSM
jgi:hypothetical protein